MNLPKGHRYLNGSRKMVIVCPSCRAMRVNRRGKGCAVCGIGLKYGRDFVCPGDWYYQNSRGWITYDDLLTQVKRS